MRAGVHPVDRADGVAGSDQQDRAAQSSPVALPRWSGPAPPRRPADLPIAGLALLDSIRLSAWLLFAVALVTIRAGDGVGHRAGYLFGAVAFCLAAIANDALGAGRRARDFRPLHVAAADAHRVRRCRTADDRESLAQYRSAATVARLAAVSRTRRSLRLRVVPVLRRLHHAAAGSIPASPWGAPSSRRS